MKIKRWDVSVLESKKIVERHDADFFTTDTNAWVEIQLVDEGITPSSATIVAYNQLDESLVEEDYPVENNLIKFPLYTEGRNLIEHCGGWLITAIFTYEGKRYTTRGIGVYVNSSPGDGVPAKLEIVESWSRIKNEVESMKAAEELRKELYYEVKYKLESGQLKGEPGDDGVDGKDGYTPIKGIDYFDGEDGVDGRNGIDGVDGEDGYTPIKGVDYFDGKDGKPPAWQVISAEEYNSIIPDPNTVYLVTESNKSKVDMYMSAVDIMLGDEEEGV